MRSGVAVGVLLLAAMAAGGCVSSSKYELAVAEAEEAKSRADKVQLQKTALEQAHNRRICPERIEKSLHYGKIELPSSEKGLYLEPGLEPGRAGRYKDAP